MLKTPLCDLFGIEVPIILAPMGTCTSAELAAAVSNNGGLGGIGSLFRTTASVKRDIDVLRKLTNKPFAINHIPQTLDPEVFRHALAARPAVISFTGRPGRSGAAGSRRRLARDVAGHHRCASNPGCRARR
jgi:enoyl-[acyl-carrier protein] reductase II